MDRYSTGYRMPFNQQWVLIPGASSCFIFKIEAASRSLWLDVSSTLLEQRPDSGADDCDSCHASKSGYVISSGVLGGLWLGTDFRTQC